MAKDLLCWRCGNPLKNLSHPVVRLAQCKACGADLHVCKFCRFYNPKFSEKCDHEMAEPARDLETANFCYYFKADPDARNPNLKNKSDAALQQLKSLFSENDETNNEAASTDESPAVDDYTSAKKKFDDLFKD